MCPPVLADDTLTTQDLTAAVAFAGFYTRRPQLLLTHYEFPEVRYADSVSSGRADSNERSTRLACLPVAPGAYIRIALHRRLARQQQTS